MKTKLTWEQVPEVVAAIRLKAYAIYANKIEEAIIDRELPNSARLFHTKMTTGDVYCYSAKEKQLFAPISFEELGFDGQSLTDLLGPSLRSARRIFEEAYPGVVGIEHVDFEDMGVLIRHRMRDGTVQHVVGWKEIQDVITDRG